MAPQHHRFDLGPATETPTPTGLGPPPGLNRPPGLNPAAPAFQPASNMSAAQQLKDKLMNSKNSMLVMHSMNKLI